MLLRKALTRAGCPCYGRGFQQSNLTFNIGAAAWTSAPGPLHYPPMPDARKTKFLPPPLVALAAWILPGSGYWLIGQRARGLVVGVTILLLFFAGLLIGGIRVVDSPWIESPQQMRERQSKLPLNPVASLLQKPWFIGQIFAGPVVLAANKVGVSWGGGDEGAPFSHSRVYEIGTLYAAVAGMLNLMAIIDAAYRAGNDGGR